MAWASILDEEETREGLPTSSVFSLELHDFWLELLAEDLLLHIAINPGLWLPEDGNVIEPLINREFLGCNLREREGGRAREE